MLMGLCATGLQDGVTIFLTILFALVAGAAIFFLYRGVRKDRSRYINSKLKTGDLDKDGFDEFLKKRFASANKNTKFTVFYIEVNDAKPLQESFGEKLFQSAMSTLQDRFYKLFPRGSRVCIYEYDAILVYTEEDMTKKEISDISAFCLVEGHKPIGNATRVKLELDLNMGVCSYNAFSPDFDTFKQNLELALVAASTNSPSTRQILWAVTPRSTSTIRR